MALKSLSPEYYCDDLRSVDWEALKAEGFKLILLDLDNTLSSHGSTEADQYAYSVVQAIQTAGLVPCLLSNASGDRGVLFAKSLGIEGIGQAGKPKTKKILKKVFDLGFGPEETMLIGDQLFTDVLCARRAGITPVKVRPRFKKELFSVRLKRPLEALVRPFIRRGQKLPELE